MKKNTTFLLVFFITIGLFGQVPEGYYDSAEGKSGYELKTAVYNIIKGHNDRGYTALWTLYASSDILPKTATNSETSTNIIWDIYSNNPNGNNPYEFVLNEDKDTGSGGGSEGEYYNREHTFPKSWFSKASPMSNDGHHILPTDKKVNNARGNYPYSEVNATWTSENGSKLGASIVDGYSGTAFEPIDEYKGDVARIYFYMATRYENIIDNWENNSDNSDIVLDGSTDKVFEDWQLNVLLAWHAQDPVSDKEINRNNAVHDFQGNRNPFIDNPNWVNLIWSGEPASDFKFTSEPVTSSEAEKEYFYDIVAKDVYNSSAVVTLTGEIVPDWLTFSDISNGKARLNGTPAVSDVGQHSVKIKAVNGSTIIYQDFIITVRPITTGSAYSETFANIPDKGSSYTDFNFIGDGDFEWTVITGRTDQSIEDKSLVLSKSSGEGSLTSPTLSNGINDISFDFVNAYSGPGKVQVWIGDTMVAESDVEDKVIKTLEVLDLKIEGNYILKIVATGRTIIDNLAWTAYSDDLGISKNLLESISLYPNPTSDIININSELKLNKYEILSINGQVIKEGNILENKISVKELKSGSYFLVLKYNNDVITKGIIRK